MEDIENQEDELEDSVGAENPKVRKPNVKETRFIEEFCCDFNAKQAAIRAGYSEKTAAEQGYQLNRRPHVQKAIKARLKELSMSAEEVTKRLTDWGRGSFAPFTRTDPEQGMVLDLASEEAQKNIGLIKKMKQTKKVFFGNGDTPAGNEYTTEIELVDAAAAVVNLGKIHGLFVTNVNHSGTIKGKLEGMDDDQLDELIEHVLSRTSK